MGSSKSKKHVQPPTTIRYRTVSVDNTSYDPLFTKSLKPDWTSMQMFPFTRFAAGIAINENEFIIVSNTILHSSSKEGVYSYKLHQHTLKQLLSYKNDLNLEFLDNPTAALNKDTNILYIHYGIYNNHKLIKINLNNYKNIKIINNPFEIGYNSKCIIINNVFHIIGGWANNKHFILNEQSNTFDVIHTFKDFNPGFGDFGLVYIKSQHKVLLLGGKYNDLGIVSDQIYSFCIITNKWKLLNIKLPEPLYSFGIVKYKLNDQYLILFGGINETHQNIKTIYIFDTISNKFTVSDIICPFDGCAKAIKTSNYIHCSMLISGYIRKFYQYRYPGQDIIHLLMSMYGIRAYAHLIGHEFNEGGIHKTMNIQDIIEHSTANWIVDGVAKSKYDRKFYTFPGKASFNTVAAVAMGYTSRIKLQEIYRLADIDKDDKLDHEEFSIFMYLVNMKQNGLQIPKTLPIALVPDSKRHLIQQ